MGRKTVTAVLCFCIFSLAFAWAARPACCEPLTVSGCSVSTVGYLTYLAQKYQELTGVKVFVRGGGSLMGISDLNSSRVDFAASCKGKSADDPSGMHFTQVAWDALVFIVNKSNPVNGITLHQVRGIYSGRIYNWKQLGGPDMKLVSFIAQGEMGGVGQSLSRLVLKGKRPIITANTQIIASSAAIWEQMVEVTPGGFASTGFASARKRNVKMLPVNGMPPTKENIVSGRYPLKRPLYLVTTGNPTPEVKKFIQFALGRTGQHLISAYGIPSLNEIRAR
ncbi:MAG: phosphate ABC transporter substrate-binding protein [Nitrospiraceae bacterium]|nr:phosphate ABC transporter substrate-binding protein [Nitrospiraceae bacterium]